VFPPFKVVLALRLLPRYGVVANRQPARTRRPCLVANGDREFCDRPIDVLHHAPAQSAEAMAERRSRRRSEKKKRGRGHARSAPVSAAWYPI